MFGCGFLKGAVAPPLFCKRRHKDLSQSSHRLTESGSLSTESQNAPATGMLLASRNPPAYLVGGFPFGFPPGRKTR